MSLIQDAPDTIQQEQSSDPLSTARGIYNALLLTLCFGMFFAFIAVVAFHSH